MQICEAKHSLQRQKKLGSKLMENLIIQAVLRKIMKKKGGGH
jgi:hypothetical protein